MIFKRNGHIRRSTPEDINRKIDQETEARIRYLSLRGKGEINTRLGELDEEWDIERMLQVNAGSFALSGILLAALHDKKWLILPGIVTAFLIQHAVQGWCPPLPLFRQMGVRTKAEIDKEKVALKAIRGDFNETSSEKDDLKRADKALKAVLED